MRLVDASSSATGITPADNLRLLPLQFLIDLKRVIDSTQHVRIKLVVIAYIFVNRIGYANPQHLFVLLTLIDHLEHTHGPDGHYATGKAGCIDKHEHIERIAIIAQRAGNETVVAGIMNR